MIVSKYVKWYSIQHAWVSLFMWGGTCRPNSTRPNPSRPKTTRPKFTRPNSTRPNFTRPKMKVLTGEATQLLLRKVLDFLIQKIPYWHTLLMFALNLIDNVEFHPIVKFFFDISQTTNVWKLSLNEFWLGEGDQGNIRVCFSWLLIMLRPNFAQKYSQWVMKNWCKTLLL